MGKTPDEMRDELGAALLVALGLAGIAYALWREAAIIRFLTGAA